MVPAMGAGEDLYARISAGDIIFFILIKEIETIRFAPCSFRIRLYFGENLTRMMHSNAQLQNRFIM